MIDALHMPRTTGGKPLTGLVIVPLLFSGDFTGRELIHLTRSR